MIQDIEPKHYDPVYRDHQPDENGKVFCFRGDEVLLTEDDQIPVRAQVDGIVERYQYLFAIDQDEYYLGIMKEMPEGLSEATAEAATTETTMEGQTRHTIPAGTRWRLRIDLRTLLPMDLALAGFTAWHLDHWYSDNRFCGRCGSKLEHMQNERMLQCPNCGHRVFPRLNPSVIVAVTDGNRLLMSRYAYLPIDWYVLIAGFVEIGETVEQCVAREVMEETGLRVRNIRYYGSQPWGMSGNVTMGYTAELDGPDEITVDPNELAEARWFERDEVPVRDDDHVSITQDMVRAFKAGRI